MAKLVYGLNQSLDGYVDHDNPAFASDPILFRHFIGECRSQAGCIYGRVMYGLMRYWDGDEPGWSDDERAYAEAWQALPKLVVSSTLTSVGPNATLIQGDLATAIKKLKDEREGIFEVAGPNLAQGLTDLGLIDEYRIYLHPAVVGKGTPFFAGATPPLRLVAHEQISDNVISLTYAPA